MRTITLIAVLAVLLADMAHGVAPPRAGGRMPDGYMTALDRNADAYRLRGGWSARLGRNDLSGLSKVGTAKSGVAGTFAVPVLMGVYAGQSAPYASTVLQTKFFDGPSANGTANDYYNEVSYGALSVTGSVTGWFTVAGADTFYEGQSNGLLEGDARTGVFIEELLDANDGAVDFGQFDNDGPDNVPNSGDDDGFVDLLVVVHNESGGECGSSTNMWSHSRDYRSWPNSGGLPYETNDAATGGGFIKVIDYTILPAIDCVGDTVDIGGLCHEIGHALGIPDLYDASGATSGIGDWGLMGSGQWNTPESPAHPCAWTRVELGWVTPTEIGPAGAIESIADIETSPVALKLGFTDGHFDRMSECAINGAMSLRCGIDAAEAAARGWDGGSGYGNGWDEAIEREFSWDGTGPVSLTYGYSYDLEADYDSFYVSVVINGVDTPAGAFSGISNGQRIHDITALLSPLTPGSSYAIRFRVKTDAFNSDEDGGYPSVCGGLVLDDIWVTGGGENYAEDFESSVGGWFQNSDVNAPTEYWLVENRQPSGFDSNLHNSGLVIYHVDDAILKSGLGNSGGSTGNTVRGIVVEEADGQFDLLADPQTVGNRGDAGDPFPGSTNNTTFNAGTTPGATDNSGNATVIEISAISASGSPMSAFARAGDPAPVTTSCDPDTMANDVSPRSVVLTGGFIRPGATFKLVKVGEPDIVATGVVWEDTGIIAGSVPIYGRAGGDWRLVVTNPDGQADTLASPVVLLAKVAAELQYAEIRPADVTMELVFILAGTKPGETFSVLRSVHVPDHFIEIDTRVERSSNGWVRFVDADVAPGTTYHYKLVSRTVDGEMTELYSGSATMPTRTLALEQNHPNPFNPTTTISFFLPKADRVRLEIYNASGALVRTLLSGFAAPGPHHTTWDGRDAKGNTVASGLYFYRLSAGKQQLTRKMILLK